MPPEARATSIVDVDGDGQPDAAWITPGSERVLGITTASGATFTIPLESASPIAAKAVFNLIGREHTPIALVDDGRTVHLFAVIGCGLHVVQNKEGKPYTFDKGFTGYGTGVGCVTHEGDLSLVGLDAVADRDGKSFTVTQTVVEFDPEELLATNGPSEVVASNVGKDDRAVETAHLTTCGDLVAGEDGPSEPRD